MRLATLFTSVVWFGATFLVVFPPCVALSRVLAEKKKEEDRYRRFLEEGARRRAAAAAEEAWEANQHTDMQ